MWEPHTDILVPPSLWGHLDAFSGSECVLMWVCLGPCRHVSVWFTWQCIITPLYARHLNCRKTKRAVTLPASGFSAFVLHTCRIRTWSRVNICSCHKVVPDASIPSLFSVSITNWYMGSTCDFISFTISTWRCYLLNVSPANLHIFTLKALSCHHHSR